MAALLPTRFLDHAVDGELTVMLKKVAILSALVLAAFSLLIFANQETTFLVESVEEIDRSPQAVWSEMTAVGTWPDWWPGVLRAELPGGWQEGAPFDLDLQGDPQKGSAVILVHAPGREIAWAHPGVLGSTGRTRLRLSGSAGTTLVTMESSIQGPQAVLARITGEEEFEKYQEAVLLSFKAYLEARGEEP